MTATVTDSASPSWRDGLYIHSVHTTTAEHPLAPTLGHKPYINSAVTMTVTSHPYDASRASSCAPSSPYDALSIHSQAFRATPERNAWQSIPQPPPPIDLPRPAMEASSSPVVSYSSMSEAFNISKGTGLIRRLSRGAHNRLRRRPSTHTNRIRDQSAGPVLVRRRSDSTGGADLAGDMSDLDLERTSEDGGEDCLSMLSTNDPANALGISSNRKAGPSAFEIGVAPTISSVLEQGTWLNKVTKKKMKRLKFRLDPLAAKVCWNPNNSSKQFYIDDVRDIRVGADAKNSRQDIQIPVTSHMEGCWMTIVYDAQERSKGRTIKTMHLLAENEFIIKLWTDALNVVSRERIEIMNALSANPEKSERSMKIAWRQAMARKPVVVEQRLDFDDAKWICRKLEINCSVDAVRTHFNQADHDLFGTLNYHQYEHFVNLFKVRKDIQSVYYAIRPPHEIEISLDTFLRFLRESQHVNVDKDMASWVSKFEIYCRSSGARNVDPALTPTMNLQAFQNFLASNANSALCPGPPDATLERPLNEYFISSSHNTYLLGRQVRGTSSVEGYISALIKGCRCVEIDCWDGKAGRPIVNHGRTMSSEIMFEDCISVIARYAFASSAYPLIISLEVHCTPEQQLIMVEIMKKYFGETLLTAPLMTNALTLPSPEELKGKILIKVKAAREQSEGLSDVTNGRRQRSSSTPFTQTSIPPSPMHSASSVAIAPLDVAVNPWNTTRASTTSSFGLSGSSSAEDSDTVPASLNRKHKGKTSNIIPKLGAFGVYACGIKYSDFASDEARKYNHIYSFAESTFDKLCKNSETKAPLEKHNMRYLMRVYPAALRVDSSNFNPLQSWKRGVQMVALNWQTYDVHLQMNEAMFAAGTDRTGYVLKPEEMRHAKHMPIADTVVGESAKVDKKGKQLVKFTVEIISAQRLPRPRNHDPDVVMNPYVEFEMFSAEDKARGLARGEGGTDASARDGSSGIGSPLRKRTKIVEGNGFDPSYNETISMMVETKYPSLIFVRWTVWNSPDGRNLSSGNNTILATFTAKLTSLQHGYRQLPLFNNFGERYRDAKLFVKIKKEAPIPLHSESAYGYVDAPASSSPRSDPVRYDARSWPRKIFSRAPSARGTARRRQQDFEGSTSRTSSLER